MAVVVAVVVAVVEAVVVAVVVAVVEAVVEAAAGRRCLRCCLCCSAGVEDSLAAGFATASESQPRRVPTRARGRGTPAVTPWGDTSTFPAVDCDCGGGGVSACFPTAAVMLGGDTWAVSAVDGVSACFPSAAVKGGRSGAGVSAATLFVECSGVAFVTLSAPLESVTLILTVAFFLVAPAVLGTECSVQLTD